jgi:hypothetical protein
MWLCPKIHEGGNPAFHLSSNQNGNGNPWKNMRFPQREDYDHSWNFISFNYSFPQKKA